MMQGLYSRMGDRHTAHSYCFAVSEATLPAAMSKTWLSARLIKQGLW